MTIWGRFSRFPFYGGVIFGKINLFKAPEMVPWLSKKSEDQPGGPRTNLEVFGDEVSFQYFQKNMKIDFPCVM
jgi:hypothetical protein